MFKLVDTRNGQEVARVANGTERLAWLNRKKVARRDWASFQMRSLPVPSQARQDAKIVEIAKVFLNLETLETRDSDSLDFSEQSVWALRCALQAAYEEGRRAATKNAA